LRPANDEGLSAPGTHPPALRLGATTEDGIAPTLFALLERGIRRRPEVARAMLGLVELRFTEDIDSVRISFEGDEVVVEDGSWEDADLVVSGRLPHVVHLTTTPMLAGIPNPATRHGRTTLGRLRRGHVTVQGDRELGRNLMRLLEL
jgi:hypothetical protein